jgi:hypothetical protein
MEKRKEGKVVANHVFPISSVQILYLERAVTALHSWHVHNKILRRCWHDGETILWCGLPWQNVLLTCYIFPRYATLQDCFTIMSTWHQHPNILLRGCQACSAIMSSPWCNIRTLETGNTWFATTFPSLHSSIFYQITKFSYGPGFMGQLYICLK